MKNRIIILLVLFVSTLVDICASGAGNVSFPELKGWKLAVSPKVYTPENLWDLINGAAESYLSYEFVDLHLADYENSGGMVIHAEIYRHGDLNNAFGIYSSERSPEYEFHKIGVQGYLDEGVLNYFTGQYYIKLYSTDSGKEVQESLKIIGKAVSDHLEQSNHWPGLLGAFPESGKLENRAHFIRENFIGLNFLSSAFTAQYDGDYKLFIIHGKDENVVLEMVQAYLKFTKQDIDPAKETSFVIRDRYNGDIPVVLKGSYLAGIIDGSDNDAAMKNLDILVKNLTEKY